LANVLSESITDLLREDLHEPADAYILTNVAERQFELTKNPLWPWMMLAVFSRGGLLPPPWVWEYLLGVALYVAEGAAEMASTSERATKRRHTVDSLVQRLCLQGKPGTPDYFTSFRQIITDLRLAMRVRRILYPENSSQKSCSLKMACNLVAQGAKKKNGRLTEAEIRAQTKLVWKAYRRFFESDGGFRMTPASRDGTLPQAHKLPDEDH
jgi:hypothetical protein